MAMRKVTAIRDSRRCYFFMDFVAILQRECQFELTGKVRSTNTAIGWMPEEMIPIARALPECCMISDDYPFLDQNYQPYVAQLADADDSKSSPFEGVGSSPTVGTIKKKSDRLLKRFARK